MDENEREQISFVVDGANYLEMKIEHLLSLCLKPVTCDYGFLVETVLHNTVISFGGKVLLIKRILDYWGWKDLLKHAGRFDDCLRMRNAFAHTPTARRCLCVDAATKTILADEMIVEAREGRRLERIDRDKAFARFKKAQNGALYLLAQIEERVRASFAQHDVSHGPGTAGAAPGQ